MQEPLSDEPLQHLAVSDVVVRCQFLAAAGVPVEKVKVAHTRVEPRSCCMIRWVSIGPVASTSKRWCRKSFSCGGENSSSTFEMK